MGNVGQEEVHPLLHDVFLHCQMSPLPSHFDQDKTPGSSLTTPAVLLTSLLRFQVQNQNAQYKGTFDAYRQISRNEGFRGLYRGFWISCFQVVSGVCYVSTYEGVRHLLDSNGITNSRVKALAGGSCASLVGQTVIVPFDVISQHMMVLGLDPRAGKSDLSANPLAINPEGRSRWQITRDIARTIYVRDGLRGFYR